MREEIDTTSPDRAIAEIASRQHGLITTQQLVEVGVDKSAIARRARVGRLHRLYRGVYAVGHRRLSREARWLAAALACGPKAVLSHRSAAALWDIRPQTSGPTEITVPATGGRAKRPGLRIHRSTCLVPTDTTRTHGIPVTTPARTIADLRRVVPPDHVDTAIRRAEIMGLDIGTQPGYEPDLARSELERQVLWICRRHRLPMPEVNARVGPYWVDVLWRDRRLIVETDGFRYHRTRSAFEADRERDVKLRLMGFTCLRFTYRQVADADSFAGALRSVLAIAT